MRVLTQIEKNEFRKTFDFLNLYVGSAYTYNKGKASIYDLRYNGTPAPVELINFCNAISKVQEIPELNIKFGFQTDLLKISILFNETSKRHIESVMDRLVKYCFKNKVQPSRLRVERDKDFSFNVIELNEPDIKVYEN